MFELLLYVSVLSTTQTSPGKFIYNTLIRFVNYLNFKDACTINYLFFLFHSVLQKGGDMILNHLRLYDTDSDPCLGIIELNFHFSKLSKIRLHPLMCYISLFSYLRLQRRVWFSEIHL